MRLSGQSGVVVWWVGYRSAWFSQFAAAIASGLPSSPRSTTSAHIAGICNGLDWPAPKELVSPALLEVGPAPPPAKVGLMRPFREAGDVQPLAGWGSLRR